MMIKVKQSTAVSVVRSSNTHVRPSLLRRSEPREIGCSELYNMTEAIKGNSGDAPTSPAAASTTPVQPSTFAPAQSSGSVLAAGTAKPHYGGVDYYKGLVMSDLQQDNGSSSADMLKRSLQLAGGCAALLGGLVLGFMWSNGLLG